MSPVEIVVGFSGLTVPVFLAVVAVLPHFRPVQPWVQAVFLIFPIAQLWLLLPVAIVTLLLEGSLVAYIGIAVLLLSALATSAFWYALSAVAIVATIIAIPRQYYGPPPEYVLPESPPPAG